MTGREIKIIRHDIMTAPSLAAWLRRLADQIDQQHSFRFDGLPIMIANQVQVRQSYTKEGLANEYALTLSWDEEFGDQAKLAGEGDRQGEAEEPVDLPDAEEVPTTPLDLPGSDEQPGIRSRG
ncbi:hypothetical protein [Tumebacillus lipolyticus]|uniref:Amphi-Trp domain-containing protein n=1 Tax=Tumebacillus lipolyticus TaxID=1280370 RepID=A0ABW5A2E1_9BACL